MGRTTNASKKAAAAAKISAQAVKKATLNEMCKAIHQIALENDGKLPYGFMLSFVEENKKSCSWVTRDSLNSAYTRYKKSIVLDPKSNSGQGEISLDGQTRESSLSDLSDSQTSGQRTKGGRPVGTTIENKRKREEDIVRMKNDISREHKIMVDSARKRGKKVKFGTLKHIIERNKKKYDLVDVNVPLKTIEQRIHRNRVETVGNKCCGGHKSPLLSIEDTVVDILLQMARIRQSLTPTRGLALVNSLIEDQPIQKNLIEWKEKISNNGKGTVGMSYWRKFMKRNEHKIVSRRGAKYELNRQNWTTYKNFVNMYHHTIEEMVHCGVAKPLPVPVWMNKHGKECEESKAFGCKVRYELTHPDFCLVGDEVGGNISMKGDGHAGGQLFITERGSVPYRKVSSSDKRFTLIGLTALNGQPVMCVIIIQGKIPKLDVEKGVDITVQPEGDSNEVGFFFNNCGKGKYFPGAPVCNFRGKEIPAMIRWNESATITSEILVDMLKTLDRLDVFPRRRNSPKPFLLLDGHQSRLEMPFMRYINTPKDNWYVCLGVPYGTALWQVEDSKDQNGSFNIALTKAKQKLLEYKVNKCMPGTLEATDMIPLINKAWEHSFARELTNKKAITERGWNPLNYNLLTYPEIRATMTKSERDNEVSSQLIVLASKLILPTDTTDASTITDDNTSQSNSLKSASSKISLNFSSGASAFCLQSIISQEQLHNAREKIKEHKDNGKETIEKLKEAKKITAGICYKSGTNRLGEDVFTVCKMNVEKKIEAMRKKLEMEEKAYLELKHAADSLIETGKSIESMSVKDITTILKSLKRKGDKAFPSKKKDKIQLYHQWKNRPPMTFDYSEFNMSMPVQDAKDANDEVMGDIGDYEIMNEAMV